MGNAREGTGTRELVSVLFVQTASRQVVLAVGRGQLRNLFGVQRLVEQMQIRCFRSLMLPTPQGVSRAAPVSPGPSLC